MEQPTETQKDDSKLLCCPNQGISLVKVPSMFRRGRGPAITGEIATPMELRSSSDMNSVLSARPVRRMAIPGSIAKRLTVQVLKALFASLAKFYLAPPL